MAPSVRRIALKVEYNGSQFNGWQSQPSDSVITVQTQLEKAVASVADQPIKIYCAGRTDAGVHATSQIVHFDTSAERQLKAWVMGVNTQLPSTVCVHWAKEVSPQFHARFSAYARRYCYVIENSKVRPAILNKLISHVKTPLNEQLMHEAGQHLIGELDFTSYRASSCQSPTAMRNVMHLNVLRRGSRVIIDIQANAFLLHMVRNIAGVLLETGNGRKKPGWAKDVLLAKDRSAAGVTAAPDGLYLVDVLYPAEFDLPASPKLVPIVNAELS